MWEVSALLLQRGNKCPCMALWAVAKMTQISISDINKHEWLSFVTTRVWNFEFFQLFLNLHLKTRFRFTVLRRQTLWNTCKSQYSMVVRIMRSCAVRTSSVQQRLTSLRAMRRYQGKRRHLREIIHILKFTRFSVNFWSSLRIMIGLSLFYLER